MQGHRLAVNFSAESTQTAWEGKQFARALNGLSKAATALSDLTVEIRSLGQQYLDHQGGMVRKTAKLLLGL